MPPTKKYSPAQISLALNILDEFVPGHEGDAARAIIVSALSGLVVREDERRTAYAAVEAANARSEAAKRAYEAARASWRLGDAASFARVATAEQEREDARRAAALAIAEYRARYC